MTFLLVRILFQFKKQSDFGTNYTKIINYRSLCDRLPKENLFFIDLATWNLLMQIVKAKMKTLKDVLKNVQQAQQRKFGFYMHLDEYGVKQFGVCCGGSTVGSWFPFVQNFKNDIIIEEAFPIGDFGVVMLKSFTFTAR